MAKAAVRVGVAGLGRAGWSIHAQTIVRHPRFELVAATDPEAERRDEARERFGCATYDSFDALLADPAVELVVVATPSLLHAPMGIAALDAGKHVLIDKPMALSTAEAEALLATARRTGRHLTAFHLSRLNPDFVQIQQVLAEGVLGPLQAVRLCAFSFDRRRDWQTLTRLGGGLLNNLGSHLIDLALCLAGGQWRLQLADLRRVAYVGDAEDQVKVVFYGRDQVLVDVELGVSAHTQPRWHLTGKYGSLMGGTERLEWKYFDPAGLPQAQVSDGPAAGRKYGSGETLPWVTRAVDLGPADSAARFYDHLAATLQDGAPSLVPPEQIRSLIALFDACRAFGREQGA